jgi:hypothetical protein
MCYSVGHGGVGRGVRLAIGLIVSVGPLAVCEARAARRYPVTANALDAAVIAILTSTFFAANVMWHLIPPPAVTAGQPSLAIPPWPLFAAMVVLLLGFSAVSLATREPALHAGSIVVAACVVLVWSASATVAPWPALAVAAALALVTVAIPLQLEKQWITIGWALEGAAPV